MLPNPMRDPRLQEILDRSISDPAFRERLLTAPHRAVRETLGIEIPESFRIRFIEKPAGDDALIVLPNAARPTAAAAEEETDADADELDEASLEAVAGGWSGGGGAPPPADWNGNDNATWTDPNAGSDWKRW